MNKHIRNIKLYEIGIDTEGKELQDFLKEKFSDLTEYKSDKYMPSLFYGKSKDNIIMRWKNHKELYQKNDWLHIKYEGLWSVFKYKFSMERYEIEEVILWWVSRKLNLKDKHTFIQYFVNDYKL